jgi:hypothetical protein
MINQNPERMSPRILTTQVFKSDKELIEVLSESLVLKVITSELSVVSQTEFLSNFVG